MGEREFNHYYSLKANFVKKHKEIEKKCLVMGSKQQWDSLLVRISLFIYLMRNSFSQTKSFSSAGLATSVMEILVGTSSKCKPPQHPRDIFHNLGTE